MSCVAISVLLIFLFTLVALFFSTNTIALRTFSRTRLQDAFKSAGKGDFIDSFVEKTEKLVLACSLYRLVANCCILLMLLAVFAAKHHGSPETIDYLVIIIVAMVIFWVFSLTIPHALAKYKGEEILSRTHKLLLLLANIVFPFLYTRKFTDGLIRRLAGVVEATPQEQQEEKQEEFLTGLEQRRIEGVVDEEEQEMIENVLELSDTAADEIMTPRTDIIAVEVNFDRQTILDIMTSAGHSRIPVYKDNIDNIIGFVYAKDLLTEIGKEPADFKLSDKIRDAYFVPETKPLRVLLHEFQNQKLHIAVVLDEYGGTSGIVTLEDILEELVGEITDEYEETSPELIKKIDKTTIDIDARAYIGDLNDQCQLNLPEDEDYDTMGGFVFSQLGYIPKAGESFDYGDLKFTIASAEARRIKRIRIKLVNSG